MCIRDRPDGISRRYPLVGKYEDKLFPNAALGLALDHYGVSFNDVEIKPGKYLSIPLSYQDEYGRSVIKIPIDKRGLMQVNWAGQWEDRDGNFDFIHYPYWILKKFRDSEYDNYVLAEVKKLSYSDPSLQGAKNLKALMKASFKEKFASKKDVIKTIRQLGMATQMESYISKTKSLNTGEQFFASIKRKAKYPQIKMYNEIKNANIKFLDHHSCHVAYAFYSAKKRLKNSAIVTLDSEGDGLNQTVWISDDKYNIRKISESSQCDIARIYKLTTLALKMKPDEHEYKVMGMAPYAKNSISQNVFNLSLIHI